ncbi:shikimate dehydrogenase [Sneathiella glossodoripedis]|uniref:shikimate dehydrogenase n=1 Tax=Sneathiella glossodoripedis TaxID=418853 RepID=UPI0004715EC0|nr:shikimate dehydrogenase [Sneathiella glossodoripedis]
MTLCAGVMGFPISHSMSPRLHGYWIKKYALDASYQAFEVRPEELMSKISSLIERENLPKDARFRGCNLTIPLKEIIIDQIDELEDAAKIIGAVNTVIIGDEGQLIGRNTDWIGFTDSLAERVDLNRFKSSKALVLGAGGAARGIIYALEKSGFSKIYLTNRTLLRAEALAKEFSQFPIEVIRWEDRAKNLGNIDLLVNTTSLGMSGQQRLEMPLEGLQKEAVVTDIVYSPLETELLKSAKERGHITIDGLGMLLHQAKAGFEAWFGTRPEVDTNLRAYVLEGLGQK